MLGQQIIYIGNNEITYMMYTYSLSLSHTHPHIDNINVENICKTQDISKTNQQYVNDLEEGKLSWTVVQDHTVCLIKIKYIWQKALYNKRICLTTGDCFNVCGHWKILSRTNKLLIQQWVKA